MKKLPFTLRQIETLAAQHPTPFYIYDEAGIRRQARRLIEAFAWNEGSKEFYAVKALPNPEVLRILKEEGCGADCSSLPELLLADRAGITGEEIMFSSNDTPAEEYAKAKEMGAIINLDDISHIEYLEKNVGLPALVACRFNPGSLESGNAIIGNPRDAKFGLTREQTIEAYRILRSKGVRRFGLHTMPISNELNEEYFIKAAEVIFQLALEIKEKAGVELEFINLGGGIGIPYRPEQNEFDVGAYAEGVRALYEQFAGKGMPRVKIFLECGRYITGPYGYLVSTVRHLKDTYKKYIGLDASMADLMRPGMYGAYHHITVLGKEDAPPEATYDVTGSLCENNDKFAIDRELPKVERGDILVIHDAGAHSHAMGFNYNGKLRHAEFLMREDGSFKMIRRAETLDDYFATLDIGN